MKYFKTLLLVLTVTTSVFVANAQKVAHINSEELIAAMPETKAMKDELSKLHKTLITITKLKKPNFVLNTKNTEKKLVLKPIAKTKYANKN